MRISIIVPVYNASAFIEDCLKSVASQTFEGDIECLLIDDCTPNNSCKVIERFVAGYTGRYLFRIIHHDINKGPSAARNTGIKSATGEYIF